MQDFFQIDRPVFEATAPGRLDVMGGVADYSGSLLLQMPIPERTTVRVQLTGENFFTVVSEVEGVRRSALVEVSEVLSWGATGAGRVNTSTGLSDLQSDAAENFSDGAAGAGRVNTSTGLPDLKSDAAENFADGVAGAGRVNTSTGLPDLKSDAAENFSDGAAGAGRVNTSTGLPDLQSDAAENFSDGAAVAGRVNTSTGLPDLKSDAAENFSDGAAGAGRVNTSTGLPDLNSDAAENFSDGVAGAGRVNTSTGLPDLQSDAAENFSDGAAGAGRVNTSTGLPDQREGRQENSAKDGIGVREYPNNQQLSKSKYSKTSQIFKTTQATTPTWTRYILGGFLLASKTFGFPLSGARIYVTSDVPVGAGLSSSAALEVATLRALEKAYDLKFEPLQLPKLAQRVENEIVGAACGLMDQLASHHGTEGQLLPIICQPAKLHQAIAIPEDIVFERISSGVTHEVSGEAYATARTAAFMGYGMLAEKLGASREQLRKAKASGDWSLLPAQGYLANLDAVQFEENLEETLPGTMLGEDFITAGYINIDRATDVDPAREYPVRAAAAHPVYEHACIRQFASLLAQIDQVDLPRHQVFARLGLLMLSSHASYSAIGLGHEATDAIVHDVIAKGAKRGYYGARVTGGGCGGTVVVLRKRT